MNRAWTVGALALGLGLGFLIGKSRAESATPDVAAPAPKKRALRVGPLTCVNVSERQDDEDRDARLASCEARIADLQGPKPTFGEPWPEDPGLEGPEEWTKAMTEVFTECGLGVELVAADCEEYPCVGALRGSIPEEDMAQFSEKLESCPAWKRWADQGKSADSEIIPMEVRCPDGSYQSTYVFTALDSESAAGEAIAANDDIADAIIHIGRRVSSVAQHWPCE